MILLCLPTNVCMAIQVSKCKHHDNNSNTHFWTFSSRHSAQYQKETSCTPFQWWINFDLKLRAILCYQHNMRESSSFSTIFIYCMQQNLCKRKLSRLSEAILTCVWQCMKYIPDTLLWSFMFPPGVHVSCVQNCSLKSLSMSPISSSQDRSSCCIILAHLL
jgi:hypothetical protein